jgi:hypothetical protein
VGIYKTKTKGRGTSREPRCDKINLVLDLSKTQNTRLNHNRILAIQGAQESSTISRLCVPPFLQTNGVIILTR